jgi:hypothetical protein
MFRNLSLILVLILFPYMQSAQAKDKHAPSSKAKETTNISAKDLMGPLTKEDWNKLGLATSELQPQPPVPGEKVDRPEFTRELLQVQWRNGDPIDLYVIKPKGIEKPPVVLYLYSYPSETARYRDDDYCQRVTHGGYAAIGFVAALDGHRYHDRPMKEWFVSELQESLAKSTHDVQMILNYLSTRGDLDMNHVGMFGEGSGGTIAVLAAAADPRITALDLLDPWGDWKDWMAKSSIIPEAERPNYIKPKFLKNVEVVDLIKWLPQLKSRSIRLQEVMDDSITPRASMDRIRQAAPPSADVIRYEKRQELGAAAGGGKLFDWIKKKVNPTPAPVKIASQ